MTDHADDHWLLRPSPPPAPSEEAFPKVEVFDDVEPLRAGLGGSPDRTPPNALEAFLFGRDARGRTATAYALLDAARAPNLPELLEASGLGHACLFTNAAADELGTIAPWLVRLERDAAFTKHLLTEGEAPWHMWGREAGLFLRSDSDFEAVWTHCRKFTRLRDDRGKWHLVRFWEPRIMWSLILRRSRIATMIAKDLGMAVIRPPGQVLIAEARAGPTGPLPGPPRLDAGDRRELMTIWSAGRMADFMATTMPRLLDAVDARRTDVEAFAAAVMDWASARGWRRQQDVARLCALHAVLGLDFDSDEEMPAALRTEALQRRASDSDVLTLVQAVRAAHAPLLDPVARREVVRRGLRPGGEWSAADGRHVRRHGVEQASALLEDRVNRTLFGASHRWNPLVSRGRMTVPRTEDRARALAAVVERVEAQMEKLP